MRHQRLVLVMLASVAALGCQDQKAWLREGLVDPLDAQRLGYRSLWRADLGLSTSTKLMSCRAWGT